jgi:predicted glycosyltransferase involved in capsule biosynthesis
MCTLNDVKERFCLSFEKLSAATRMQSDSFYLSGFEVIFLNHNRSSALKTVLSSVVSFDNKLLILEKEQDSIGIPFMCKELGLDYSLYMINKDEDMWKNVEILFSTNKRISHVLIEIDNAYNALFMNQLVLFCEHINVELIVLFKGYDEMMLNNCMLNNVSYVILSELQEDNQSFIVAKRSSLVQTEGVSGLFAYDLHRHWQQLLNNRKSIIQPMAV